MEKSLLNFEVPREWRRVRPWLFVAKLGALVALLCAGAMLIAGGALPLGILGGLLVGAMFAHAIELQHQCLHGTALQGPRLNRLVGVALGLPMFVSFTKYRVQHLRHHRYAGTQNDSEFFAYGSRLEDLSFWRIVLRSFSLARYQTAARDIGHFVLGFGERGDGFSEKDRAAIRQEYLLALLLLAVAIGASVALGSAFVIKFWLLPAILVAEPSHFWIELPEHFGCAKLTVFPLGHTRTIRGSLFSFWFTNGNNFHAEHHLVQHVPIDRLPGVHALARNNLVHYDRDYVSFVRDRIVNRTFAYEGKEGLTCLH